MKKLTLTEMKDIAHKRGGLCLSQSYENSQSKLRWRCAKGHEWEAAPYSIKSGNWCRQCAVEAIADRRRIPLQEILEMAKSKGGQCLSREYVGNKDDKLRWRCSEGHEWEATLGKVRNDGSWCPTCAKLNRRLTLEDMRQLARAKGGECLSDTYHGLNGKLQWRCAYGHEWEASPGHIRNQGCWCPKCAGRAPLKIVEMREIARSRGGECLSESLINALTKLRWRCAEGHEWEAAPNDVKGGHWCRKCGAKSRAARRRTSLKEIQALAHSKGGKCLSKKYDNSEILLHWQCARGHEWDASFRNVKNNNSWCPICSAGVSERICRGIFEALFQVSFPKVRPDWLKNERGNWMELDGYCKELRIAFEYHGIQHYEFNPFFHNEKSSFAQRQQDDRQRAELCRARSISLIEIPYTIQHKDIERFVRKASKTMGIHIPNQDPVNLEDLLVYEDDPLEELRILAQAKGGECLSTIYINRDTKLLWRCSEGHEWEMPAHAVRNSGQWCPRCGIRRRSDAQRLTIEDMRELARSKGGNFLSAVYEGVRFKHRWRCAQGHEWDAKAGNVKNGSWCPECAGHTPLTIEEMRSIAVAKGGRCLSNQYLGTEKKLRWRCSRSHEWEATPYNIKHRNQWCPICGNTTGALKRRLTIDEMRSLAQSRGGQCLSDQYAGNNKKLRWKCSEGHVWEATPHAIKDGGQWCPQCRRNRKTIDKPLTLDKNDSSNQSFQRGTR